MRVPEFNGSLRVDRVRLAEVEVLLIQELLEKQLSLNEQAGFSVNVNSAKSLDALFRGKLGIEPKRLLLKRGGIPSYSKEVVRTLETPFTSLVLELKSLYAKRKYFTILHGALDGDRVSFELAEESVTGRLYAKNPCVMSFPAEIRGCVVPDNGNVFIGADFVSQELTIIAKSLGCASLVNAVLEGVDVFQRVSDLSGVDRDRVKLIVYAFMYGSRIPALAFKTLLSEDKVSGVLSALFSYHPEMANWHSYLDKIKEQGYSESLFGERYYIDRQAVDLDKELRRAANFRISATASYILRDMLPKVGEFSTVKVFVHDSIVTEVAEELVEAASGKLETLMRSYLGGSFAVKLRSGDSWRKVWEKDPVL